MTDFKEESLSLDVLEGIQTFAGPSKLPEVIEQGQALQQVKTQYTTAVKVQEPRSIARFASNVMQEAALAGSSFYYGWTVKGGNKIEGGSIDLAMCLFRNYGNCVIDMEVTETNTHYLFKAYFVDLETGATLSRLFRQRKSQKLGKFDQDRAEDIAFQIGQSKAERNVVLKAMPGWLTDQAINKAKEAALSRIKPENMHLARQNVITFFAEYGATQDRIEDTLSRKADEWTAQDIVDLRGMATALKEKRISVDELFPKIDKTSESLTQEILKPKDEPKPEDEKQPPVETKEKDMPESDFMKQVRQYGEVLSLTGLNKILKLTGGAYKPEEIAGDKQEAVLTALKEAVDKQG
ncbi:MAG: hypothetical protein GY718_14445 [Lentisphaerae bacterium]|nr:hypothetical protein [Lentisphaerota bacterium]